MNKDTNIFDVPPDDEEVVLISEEGEEMPFSILTSRDIDGEMFILAADSNDGDVLHFKCIPTEDEDLILELVDEEHEDFQKVFEMFKDEYEAFGIEIEE